MSNIDLSDLIDRGIRARINELLHERIPTLPTPPPALRIDDVSPALGLGGTVATIAGSGFSSVHDDNDVQVGGAPALVMTASPTELRVMVAPDVQDGPIAVRVGADAAVAPMDWVAAPDAGSADAGPPLAFAGSGPGPAAGGVPTSGTLNVLVSLMRPADETIGDPTSERQAVIDAWDEVITFFDQASYSALDVEVTVTATWGVLADNKADYIDGDNIKNEAVDPGEVNTLDRFVAEAAQHAVDQGEDLNHYHLLAATIFLDGDFIRAWGGWARQTFSDPDNGISITLDDTINLIAIQETANWGRCAHELAHSLVDSPSFEGDDTSALGEDVYTSDLVDAGSATAAKFEMMGSHDDHPLFSGYNLEQLDWYDASNIATLNWDRNATSQTFEVIAHGLAQNTSNSRAHLVKVRISSALSYYIQVRQRPDGVGPVFDDNIPLGGSPVNDGGVIVTTVLSEVVNNNHQMRFITLLHDDRVLTTGESASDPARDLTITVEDADVQARPQVCRVRVEWAQDLTPDPSGRFDLQIEPWDSSYQTPDIWVDREPFDTFDNPVDAEGRPTGNGDKPEVGEANRFYARIHNDGSDDASNVPVTFYTVEPPGVGDNGNWAPISSTSLPTVAAGGFQDARTIWVPLVGRHTCLKVFIGEQLGEVSYANNNAQENVSQFEAPSSSRPDAVTTTLAVRNPRNEDTTILLSLDGVPDGWVAGISHSWVRLSPLGETTIELHAIPLWDFEMYYRREAPRTAPLRVSGYVPRSYRVDPLASSHMMPIGGVMNEVTVKKRAEIELVEEGSGRDELVFYGRISPAFRDQRLRVSLTEQSGNPRHVMVTTGSDGGFVARFDVDPQGRLWKAVARTLDADLVARTESNCVIVDRRRNPPRLKDLVWTGFGSGRVWGREIPKRPR